VHEWSVKNKKTGVRRNTFPIHRRLLSINGVVGRTGAVWVYSTGAGYLDVLFANCSGGERRALSSLAP